MFQQMKRWCRFLCKWHKKCPQHKTKCEGNECKQRREQIAAANLDEQSGLLYTYVPENVSYETAVNQCDLLGFGYRLATINELHQLAHLFTYIEAHGDRKRCPTLVWSTDENGNPVIVRIMPCSQEQIEVIRKFARKKCNVQRICVVSSI